MNNICNELFRSSKSIRIVQNTLFVKAITFKVLNNANNSCIKFA